MEVKTKLEYRNRFDVHPSTHSALLYNRYFSQAFNPSNVEATFVQITMTQRSLRTIQTLSCWYPLDSSR